VPTYAADTDLQVRHMDACCIAPDTPVSQVVLLADVLTHCASPRGVLGRFGGIRGLVCVGGVVVISETWAWDTAKTPEGTWLGASVAGANDAPATADMDAAVAEALGDGFTKVWQQRIPRISALARDAEYLLTIPEVTVWRREH
jgi:hypothetical protein